ncbi:hypothetical protein [Flavobacterium sp.]|jgi:hypothetical protein|uniref:hypothetical protein n=1 Tax=Flavobacterium sp. TaxID=239 RepID=UPI0037C0112F
MINYYIKGQTDKWVRPAGWLTMPTITAAENKCAFLLAVYADEENYFAVSYGSGSCNYTIDWGDGTTITVNNSTAIQTKRYDYSLISSIVLQDSFGIDYKQVIITVTLNFGALSAWTINSANAASRAGKSQILETVISHSHSLTFNSRIQTMMESLKIIKFIPTGVVTNNLRDLIALKNFEGFENIDTTNTTTSGTTFANIGPVWQSLNFTWNSGAAGMTSILASSRIKKFGNVTLLGTGGLTTAMSSDNIEEIGDVNLGNHNTLTSMFQNNFNLRKIGTITIGGTAVNITTMFQNCYSLQEIVFTDCANITTITTTTFVSCFALRRLVLPNIVVSVTAPVGCLQRTALVELFMSLGSPLTTQTLTITGNPGIPDLLPADLLIATSKNWTVFQ